jgi:glucokinase
VILTGDVGGTKTLLALHEDDGAIVERRRYRSQDAATFDQLVARFIAETAAAPQLACFGIAGPVLGARVKVTHLPWEIDAGELAVRFGLQRVQLLNDFAAAAHGIGALASTDIFTLQPPISNFHVEQNKILVLAIRSSLLNSRAVALSVEAGVTTERLLHLLSQRQKPFVQARHQLRRNLR